jgi:small subunit ribosomal protein S2
MEQVGVRELLEAGVHFGHQTQRWNPKMRRYLFGERGGIHIIDLQQTERLLARAQEFAGEVAGRGGTVLFVGTKKQARDTIAEAASAAGMPYVHQRWLGGLLTNWNTISQRIERLHELRSWTESGTMDLLPTRERIAAMAERDKLETNLGGVADMQRQPDAMFVVDLKTEVIAVREAEEQARAEQEAAAGEGQQAQPQPQPAEQPEPAEAGRGRRTFDPDEGSS